MFGVSKGLLCRGDKSLISDFRNSYVFAISFEYSHLCNGHRPLFNLFSVVYVYAASWLVVGPVLTLWRPLMGGAPMSHVDFKKWQCPCRLFPPMSHVEFKKGCHMSI